LLRLLTLLRAAPETHFGLTEILHMATEAGFNTTHADLARQLETLADHGLLVRLFSTAAEPVFDTVTEPHSHLVYEETAQIVDLHDSAGTLLEILRRALADRPNEVEILIRFRQTSVPAGTLD